MTESPFPFGAVEEVPLFEDEPESGSRRALVALGALAAVVLAGGAFFVLSGDDAEDEFAIVPRAQPTSPAAEAPAQAITLPVASTDQLGRNPFKALYIQPPAETTDPGETTPVAPPPVVQPQPVIINPPVYIPPPTSNPAPAPAPVPAPVPTTPPTAVEHPLVLDDVYGLDGDRSAVFIVDGKQMIAQVGTVFGPTAEIKLILLQEGPGENQWTATLQVGDGDPFDVITGETVFVR